MIVMQICLRGKSDSKARNTQKKPTFSRRPLSSGRGEHHPRIGRGRSLALPFRRDPRHHAFFQRKRRRA